MKLALAFIDLDDTLLGNDKRISAENRQALRRLQEAGVHPVLASGRHIKSMRQIATELPEIEWLISMQGGLVTDTTGENVLFEALLPKNTVRQVVDLGVDRGYTVMIYSREHIFANPAGAYVELYTRLSGHRPTVLNPYELVREDVFKVLWLEQEDRIAAVADMVELAQLDAYLVRTQDEIFEFMPKHANKGAAAAALAQHLGVAPEACVAFGDGNNDVPMLEWAGESVAMDHGWQDAKTAARHVTPAGVPNSAFARGVELLLGS